MNTLELTLISMAQQQLSAVLRFNEKRESGAVSDDDVDDYLRDSGALSVLLELGHVSDSGMSVDAISAMLEIETKHSAAVRAANPLTSAATAASRFSPIAVLTVTQDINALRADCPDNNGGPVLPDLFSFQDSQHVTDVMGEPKKTD